nr:MAG TPA: hypothetical protein [Caudoviricetes sp.]
MVVLAISALLPNQWLVGGPVSGINAEAHHLNDAISSANTQPRRHVDRVNPTGRAYYWTRRQSGRDLVRERLRADAAATRGGLGVHVDGDRGDTLVIEVLALDRVDVDEWHRPGVREASLLEYSHRLDPRRPGDRVAQYLDGIRVRHLPLLRALLDPASFPSVRWAGTRRPSLVKCPNSTGTACAASLVTRPAALRDEPFRRVGTSAITASTLYDSASTRSRFGAAAAAAARTASASLTIARLIASDCRSASIDRLFLTSLTATCHLREITTAVPRGHGEDGSSTAHVPPRGCSAGTRTTSPTRSVTPRGR